MCSRHASGVLLAAALVLPALVSAASPPGVLPVHIEDNHAGSFGFFARVADLDEPHVLVLIDAHSDASAAVHSDEMRDGLRRVASAGQRAERIEEWRRTGRVQAFNWIEPLMPSPIAQVVWVCGWEKGDTERRQLESEARESVDGRLEFEARSNGELGQSWQVVGAEEFGSWIPPDLPVLATIDLDSFAGVPSKVAEARFRALWKRLLDLPDLRAVSFAISRPWLDSDAEAARLLLTALEEVRHVRGARVDFEPYAQEGPDDSLRAGLLKADGQPVPRFSVDDAPRDLRAFLATYGHVYSTTNESERWRSRLERWVEEMGSHEIRVDGVQRSTDEIWRIPVSREFPPLRVRSSIPTTGRVRWWALRSAAPCYNLLPGIPLGKAFAPNSVPWVREVRAALGETEDGALAGETWSGALDAATGWGRLRIEAEVETDGGWVPVQAIEIRVFSGTGFRAGLSEQFGLPYVFGIGFAVSGEVDGADVGWGNDCANFLVAAWRRTGRAIPWGSPAQLRTILRTLKENADAECGVPLSPGDVDRGVAVDFGNHMAAVWEDCPPLGELDGNDLVVHHLGGVPERTTLAELARDRLGFAVRTLDDLSGCRVDFGGDVVLSQVDLAQIPALAARTDGADIAIVNLEGAPRSEYAHPVASRYDFSFPPERLQLLLDSGITAVGTANNHAADAGVESIAPGVEAISSFGFGVFGAGRDEAAALQPWRIEREGAHLAFFAVSCVDARIARSDSPGVASLPTHASELEAAIRAEKAKGRTVIVLVHWGREYTHLIEDSQRIWARWLVSNGADAVVGAHPHLVQSLDFYRGRIVAYSLGNAVFPPHLGRLGEVGWLSLSIGSDGGVGLRSYDDGDRP